MLVGVVIEDVVVDEGGVVVGAVVVEGGGAAPGIHCEYQGLRTVQIDPDEHVIGPVQPMPPPMMDESHRLETI